MTDAAHNSLIRDQFTRQATPFSTAAPIADAGALTMIIEAAGAGSDDSVLALAELKALFRGAGLPMPQASFYELRDEVKNLLARSFPNPGDEEKITDLFSASIADDRLGIPVHRDGDKLEYAYPVAILAAPRA